MKHAWILYFGCRFILRCTTSVVDHLQIDIYHLIYILTGFFKWSDNIIILIFISIYYKFVMILKYMFQTVFLSSLRQFCIAIAHVFVLYMYMFYMSNKSQLRLKLKHAFCFQLIFNSFRFFFFPNHHTNDIFIQIHNKIFLIYDHFFIFDMHEW